MYTSNDPFRVVVAAGGTGGHIFPAVAVVERLAALTDGHITATFLGSRDRMETRLIPSLGYDFVPMPITGLKGLFHPSTLSLPWKIMQSTRIARATIRVAHPHVVICTGAYISYPAGVAAAREHVPLVVLESNVNPGKTNRRLAPLATSILLSFEESLAYYPNKIRSRCVVTGNPVRAQITTSISPAAARTAWGLQPQLPTVLVFGGSLGARRINHAIESALPRLATAPYQVLWQTGSSYDIPANLPSNVVAMPFISNMGEAYAAADLVVCRSGATTIAELGIVGKPAVFLPLPTASTREQHHNANVVARAGGAVVIEDDQAMESLATTIDALMSDDARRAAMSVAMHSLGRPDAANAAATIILERCAQRGNT